MNELNKNYGKMTHVEKRMNRNDLRAYKRKDRHTVNAMIPGIHNVEGIGSKPLLRGAMKLIEEQPHRGTGKGGIYFSP